jgi:hypothetical protein
MVGGFALNIDCGYTEIWTILKSIQRSRGCGRRKDTHKEDEQGVPVKALVDV